jgi:hypothetical protein
LFIKNLILDRVVPIITANVSRLIGLLPCALSGLPDNPRERTPRPLNRDYRFLAGFGDNREFDLNFLDIKDCVCRVGLRKTMSFSGVVCNRSSCANFIEKDLGIKGRRFWFPLHMGPRTTSLTNISAAAISAQERVFTSQHYPSNADYKVGST